MATVPTTITLEDGTAIDAHSSNCDACGEPLDNHSCTNGAVTTVIYSRSGKGSTRKTVSAHPTCPHCGGRVHFNMSGTAINAECLVRQYALDKALIADPNDRLPILTIEMMGDIAAWASSLSKPVTYGKMESAAGGAATYSGLRPKSERKKKAVAAGAGEKIEDIAASVEAPAPKARKSMTAKQAAKMQEEEAVKTAEEIVAKPKRGRPPKATPVLATRPLEEIVAPEETVATNGGSEESDKDRRRRERSERRKQLLGNR